MSTTEPPITGAPTPSAGDGAAVVPDADPWSGTRPVAVDPSTYLRGPTVWQRVRGGFRVVTPAGWFALVLTAGSWLAGWRLGWDEFLYVTVVGGVCLLAALAQVLGRVRAAVEVEVVPQRVVVGERSAAQVVISNDGSRRRLPTRMELTVGEGVAEFDVPSLSAGSVHEELFILPTTRRAVIPVGPATAVRGDPLGLLRRSAPLTDPVPLIVHPRIVAVGSLGFGLLRDLEGQTTPEISPADVAFHALRDYEPGDDRRFIHWLTSARVGRLVVRQFNDTRRAHLAVVMDGDRRAYADEEDFETAVSVVGSLGVRALADDQDLTVAVSGRRLPTFGAQVLLDALSAVQAAPRRTDLLSQVQQVARAVSDVSLAVMVTGASVPVADLRAAAMRFDAGVRTLAVRIGRERPTGFRQAGSTTVVDLASLDDLGRVLWAVAGQ